LRDQIEEGVEPKEVDPLSKQIPKYLQQEIEFYRNITNEMIDIRAGATEAVNAIHAEIKNLVYNDAR
jgi:hypothetical protein